MQRLKDEAYLVIPFINVGYYFKFNFKILILRIRIQLSII